ncbi:hypothetical protein SNEBB_006532 [Seison nebaliae]|nr:hypothetical protein SNEBB_006532 [Seison nebaliae]
MLCNSSVGIINPPTELKSIVDVTAQYVAKNGSSFEVVLRQKEANNPRFSFLTQTDPYFSYYQHKIEQFKTDEGELSDQSTNRFGEGGTSIGENGEVLIPQFSINKNSSTTISSVISTGTTTTTMTNGNVNTQIVINNKELVNMSEEIEKNKSNDSKSSNVGNIVRTEIQQKLLEKLVEPEPYEFFTDDITTISQCDIDLIRLTARYVAQNGRQFLVNLVNRVQNNSDFDFLKSQHSLFPFFTKLVEQYIKIILCPKSLLKKFVEYTKNRTKFIETEINPRLEWKRHLEKQKQLQDEKIERERNAYQSIDWHNFVVVETVEYSVNETGNFPPPTTPDKVGARILAQQRYEEELKLKKMNEEERGTSVSFPMEVDEEKDEEEIVKEKEKYPGPPPQPLPPPPEEKNENLMMNGKLVKDYDPKNPLNRLKSQDKAKIISPITNCKLPLNKIDEHIRHATIDPKWKDTREMEAKLKKEAQENANRGDAIYTALEKFEKRRPDIFHVEKTEKTKKTDAKEKVTWDGHSNSMMMTARKAIQSIDIQQQQQLQEQKKFHDLVNKIGPTIPPTDDISMIDNHQPESLPQQRTFNPPPLIPTTSRPPLLPLGTSDKFNMTTTLKRSKTDEQPIAQNVKRTKIPQLESEAIWLGRYGNKNVIIQIKVPKLPEKREFNLKGQTITISLPLTDPVSVIKNKLQEETHLAPSKQKLQCESIFLNDQKNSLAFYNVKPNTQLMLQLKERGGRKR